MIQHIVVDFDGTLADSAAANVGILRNLTAKHQISIPVEKILQPESLGWRDKAKLVAVGRSLEKEYRTLFREASAQAAPVEGMPQLLHWFVQQGYGVTVISSRAPEEVSAYLHRYLFPQEILVRQTQKLVGKAAALRDCQQETGLQPEEILYLGDETRDIAAGAQTGVPVVLAHWGILQALKVSPPAGPVLVANHPKEIEHYLLEQRK